MRIAAIIVFMLCTILVVTQPVLALSTAAQRWQYYNTSDDTFFELQGINYGAQTFTTTTSHEVNYVRVKMYQSAGTGVVTFAIQAVNASGAPDGVDLCSGTIDTDSIGTTAGWYTIDVDDHILDGNTTYALVGRNTGINAFWRSDGSAATYSGGSEWTSLDGGATWTQDTDDDFMFEIWGMSALQLSDATAYSGFAEDGDWLIVAKCLDEFAPYYPYYNPKDYFNIQLLAESTVKAQSPLQQWSMTPVSLYLNSESVESLEWGNSTYTLRLNGTFTSNPNTSSNITWVGTDLNNLDSWCLLFAGEMGEYYGEALTTLVEGKGTVLTQAGGIVFSMGIPGLQYVRPNIFAVVSTAPIWEDEDFSYTYAESLDDWETAFGSDIADIFGNISTEYLGGGISGKNIFALVVFGIFVVLAGAAFGTGHPYVGIILGLPTILVGVLTGLIPIVAVFAILSLMVIAIVWSIWWSRT